MKAFFDPATSKKSLLRILSLNIAETKRAYTITLLAPGLHQKNISVFTEARKITITNKKIKNKNALQEPEYSFATFTKTFTTVHGINRRSIKLNYKNNIISMTFIKKKKAVVISPY